MGELTAWLSWLGMVKSGCVRVDKWLRIRSVDG